MIEEEVPPNTPSLTPLQEFLSLLIGLSFDVTPEIQMMNDIVDLAEGDYYLVDSNTRSRQRHGYNGGPSHSHCRYQILLGTAQGRVFRGRWVEGAARPLPKNNRFLPPILWG